MSIEAATILCEHLRADESIPQATTTTTIGQGHKKIVRPRHSCIPCSITASIAALKDGKTNAAIVKELSFRRCRHDRAQCDEFGNCGICKVAYLRALVAEYKRVKATGVHRFEVAPVGNLLDRFRRWRGPWTVQA
jgi:hypothetical protein